MDKNSQQNYIYFETVASILFVNIYTNECPLDCHVTNNTILLLVPVLNRFISKSIECS